MTGIQEVSRLSRPPETARRAKLRVADNQEITKVKRVCEDLRGCAKERTSP